MRSRINLIAVLLGLGLSSVVFFDFFPHGPAINSPASLFENSFADFPVRLKIPKLGVDADIEAVGTLPGGAMDVPRGPGDAAWFEPGPRPGESGSAVIAGHFGWKDGIPAIFDNLHKLRPGDKIYIEDDAGVTIAFIVRELRTYSENDDASEVFNSTDGESHLNLITCGGVYDKKAKSYSERLVVFADKVE